MLRLNSTTSYLYLDPDELQECIKRVWEDSAWCGDEVVGGMGLTWVVIGCDGFG
jgi:hypothetical protein